MPISIEILQNVTQNALPSIFTCTKNIPYEFGEPHYFFSNKKSTLKFCSQFWVDSLYYYKYWCKINDNVQLFSNHAIAVVCLGFVITVAHIINNVIITDCKGYGKWLE